MQEVVKNKKKAEGEGKGDKKIKKVHRERAVVTYTNSGVANLVKSVFRSMYSDDAGCARQTAT